MPSNQNKRQAEPAEPAPAAGPRPGWKNRIVGHGLEDPGQLLANPRNWRIHPKNQQNALEGVLKQVGWVQDVIVNQRTGHVVDGHLRISVAISRGERVPVVYVDLSEEEEALILASLDPLAAMAGADRDLLGSLLQDIQADDAALSAMFDEMAASVGVNRGQPGLTEDDAVPEVSEVAVTRPGDLWLLGAYVECPHCGSKNEL